MNPRTGATYLILGLFLASGAPVFADDPQFALSIKEHRFVPSELQVPAGVKVKLLIKNEDSTPEEFESHELHREKVVPPGQEITVFVGPLDAGTYPFFGDFHQDTAQGKLIAK
ncbi:MAG TPA: cupredoxin domain-containing protein [Stellaceae bacterium]|nr:cupredoxin domain-containing protein [Stellaceae bacterium]